MLQEKHFDLIHFGTVTCNTISGKIKLEDGQCWQSETRQKKYEASGLEFKKSQLWIILPNLNTPGGCTVFLQGQEAKKDVGMTNFFPKQFPSLPLDLTPSAENMCTDRPSRGSQWLQTFPLAQTGSWSSLTHFIILFFFSVGHSHEFQTSRGEFPLCYGTA